MVESLGLLRWLRPELLWLLLPWVALTVWRLQQISKEKSGDELRQRVDVSEQAGSPWASVISPALLPHLLAEQTAAVNASSPSRSPVSNLLQIAAMGVVVVFALAGPQFSRPSTGTISPQRPDVARVLVVDLTPAFAALPDQERQRIRHQLRRFIRSLPPGETGLVISAGEAWPVVPLTEDAMVLDGFIADLAAEAVPVPGDRPEKALALANRILESSGAQRQSIYWMRAGGDVSVEMAEAKSGIRPVFLQAGQTWEQWRVASGVPTGNPPWRLSRLGLVVTERQDGIDLGPWLLVLVLLWVAPRVFLFRRPLVGQGHWMVAFLMIAGLDSGGAQATTLVGQSSEFAEGVAHYRSGRYSAAAIAFSRADQNDHKSHYNRGNALARSGKFADAVSAYDFALSLRPHDADARYNRDLVARLIKNSSLPPPPPEGDSGRLPPPVSQQEAGRALEQWLRRPPAGTQGLLARKLAIEEKRRRQNEPP